jgi:hypothetical protein
MTIEFGDAATWIAAFVAIYSALAAGKSSKAADRYQEAAAREARRAADLLEKNHHLELRSWTDQYFSGVRTWADQVCCAISEAIHLVSHEDLSETSKHPVLVKLSHLIDTGRWHFPNQWSADYGVDKEPAYRGVRKPVLDCVVAAYNALKRSRGHGDSRDTLWSVQRQFVSHIQDTLDPRSREQEIRRVLEEFEQSQRLRALPRKS